MQDLGSLRPAARRVSSGAVVSLARPECTVGATTRIFRKIRGLRATENLEIALESRGARLDRPARAPPATRGVP
jgi:hypothetical protein